MFTSLWPLMWRLICLWLLCVPGLASAAAEAKSQEDARHIVHILSYVAGDYGGVSADASVGIGGGANVLLGGSNKSIRIPVR